MLLLNHKTRCAAVLIRLDVVQMSRHYSQSLLCSKEPSVSGLIMMLANVLLLQDHDVLRNRSSRLEMVTYLLSVVVVNGGCGCYRVGGARGAQTR
ncbi:transmembrane protein, putative [Medicago truncatula]|uniref:Transmembrane protein, putative n=1 Tax=Medicago truncatula TaxID=3880 RepID=A0A072VLJ3_MEDTR|nr:transmembrane protein, putative [Medicago truncatula]